MQDRGVVCFLRIGTTEHGGDESLGENHKFAPAAFAVIRDPHRHLIAGLCLGQIGAPHGDLRMELIVIGMDHSVDPLHIEGTDDLGIAPLQDLRDLSLVAPGEARLAPTEFVYQDRISRHSAHGVVGRNKYILPAVLVQNLGEAKAPSAVAETAFQ